MMMYAYNELYLNDAKENLAIFFDYGVRVCKIKMDLLTWLFVKSGYADKFERGNPAVIAGMSGVELARIVIHQAYPNKKFEEYVPSNARSDLYWAGWSLAEYQWATCTRFKDIFEKILFSEIVLMYKVYHEMSIENFIEDLNKRLEMTVKETRLKTIRESRGLSQSELAKFSGVNLRSIQLYEQKINDIDKAQVGTVYKLSRVLGCTVEELLESPGK